MKKWVKVVVSTFVLAGVLGMHTSPREAAVQKSLTVQASADYVKLFDDLKSELKKAGVTLKLEELKEENPYEEITSGKVDLLLHGTLADLNHSEERDKIDVVFGVGGDPLELHGPGELSSLGDGSEVFLPEEAPLQTRALTLLAKEKLVSLDESKVDRANLEAVSENKHQLKLTLVPLADLGQKADGKSWVLLPHSVAVEKKLENPLSTELPKHSTVCALAKKGVLNKPEYKAIKKVLTTRAGQKALDNHKSDHVANTYYDPQRLGQ